MKSYCSHLFIPALAFSLASCGDKDSQVTLAQAVAEFKAANETIVMVDIPAGSFLMGSVACNPYAMEAKKKKIEEENRKRAFLGQPASPPAIDDCKDPDATSSEAPQHYVNVPAFQMSKTEVTLGQFKKFITAAGRQDLLNDRFIKDNSSFSDDMPVKLEIREARPFIEWLNQVEGGGWRLPSEAEWEYACRASGSHLYCGSDNPDEIAWYKEGQSARQPVAAKRPNAFGLYDMTGNVSEWTQDCWHSNYQGAPTDGSAWIAECQDGQIVRGGSAGGSKKYNRAAYRSVGASASGLRLVKAVNQVSQSAPASSSSEKLDPCLEKKIADYRKAVGEEAVIGFQLIEEWESDCRVGK